MSGRTHSAGTPVCPVCGQDFDHDQSLQRHLMVDHRKSVLTEELLTACEPDPRTARDSHVESR
jgi:hypothetical protein